MTENFPNLRKETSIQMQKSQRVPNKMNTKRHTARHIITMGNVKENFKGSKRINKESHTGKCP